VAHCNLRLTIREVTVEAKQRISLSSYPLRGIDSASCVIDGQTLIVQSKDRRLFVLNATGTKIWELSDGKHELREIIKALTAKSKKPESQIRKETEEFIKELVEREILVLLKHPWDIAA